MAKNPRSVLDIGIGFGKFGFLAREYTDVRFGRYFNWETRIDGIEIFEKYVTQLQRQIYDNIYIGNATDILPNLSNYDIIICSDMLEHLSVEDGTFLLNTIKQKSKFAMIVTPVRVLRQEALYNNEHERHVSVWPTETLGRWGKVTQFENAYLLEISSTVQAKYGDTVRVHYTGKLEDGTVLATTTNKPPAQFTLGQGHDIRGLDIAVVGMSVGEFSTAKISADNAYGPYRREMTQTVPINQFPANIKPSVGQMLQDHQEDGRIINVKVAEVCDTSVTLDANHPLAGKDIIFDVQLIDIF